MATKRKAVPTKAAGKQKKNYRVSLGNNKVLYNQVLELKAKFGHEDKTPGKTFENALVDKGVAPITLKGEIEKLQDLINSLPIHLNILATTLENTFAIDFPPSPGIEEKELGNNVPINYNRVSNTLSLCILRAQEIEKAILEYRG